MSLPALQGLHAATAAHAQIGTPVPNPALTTLAGEARPLLRDAQVNVLVFFRPYQENSLSGLKELAGCRRELAAKPVQWTAVVSDSVAVDSAASVMRESGLDAPTVRDARDAVYGSLGIALHPVVVIVGTDGRLAAFEAFHSVNYCAVVAARIRRVLGEITESELSDALSPPPVQDGGARVAARRHLALAEALFKAGNYGKALELARAGVDREPTSARAQTLLGHILSAQGKCEEAVAAYGKAVAIDSGSADARDGIMRCRSGAPMAKP